MKKRSRYTGIPRSNDADGDMQDGGSSSPATSSQSAYQSTSSMQATRLLPPTSKVVAALRHGDLEGHVRNFGRHLRRPGAEDQTTLDQLLDGLDDLSSVDKYIYCRIVQRLAETLLEHCLGYLCTDAGNPDVCLDLKMQSVLRILWMSCLYPPALQRIAQAGVDLIPMMNRLILSCLRTSENLRENKANRRHEQQRERKISRESVSSASEELVLSSYSMNSVVVSALAISYNCLYASWDRDVIVVCCQCGFIRTVVSLLSRTRNIIIGETCLRILDLMGQSGGNTSRTLLREYQVMKEASRLWHYMIRRDLITKSGFLVAGLIARLGENLRQADGTYTEWTCNPGTTSKRAPVYRTPHLKMIRWCSSPGCNRSEELKNGPKFRLCSRCRLSRYCSEDCQRFHWNRGHKVECFPLMSRDHSVTVQEERS
ncbi:uncharacterized protein LOC110987187 [Acanthaster planci]|uniref:Uncharacterized protein LOC110987187 n=1 Tax=Acanthaster planci TaxID=133434 RepID=A0A8B7ZKF7_ACAPL|nr:uncharacterized protein LOC110987187 [Acanthaster planci]XP_022105374.1 uncharacterized protein LOC110987187 [Acanthaster planci]XP_022105375.1 uncharacterized protein LOC110987187 [Acanthaster planci]